MAAKSPASGSNMGWIVPLLLMVVASPLLLMTVLITGIFTMASLMQIIGNLYVIGIVFLLNILFFTADRLSTMSVVFTGGLVGFGFWAVGLLALFSGPMGGLCQIPILGSLLCGTISLVSIFTSLLGFLAGAMIVSFFIGGFLMLIR